MFAILETTLGLAQTINPQLARRTEARPSTHVREETRREVCEEEEETGPSQEVQLTAAFLIGRLSRK
ncbi:hypothetical protein KWAN_56 [Erwinia phage vB_EamM_Kwan]|uniref:Uncharacterized protein n=1 Tax=Erwinia phage vB_EamM_Kwan TaxID=1883374 RepID=A0A1B2IDS6_9CAUD|nr:hypothetical protein BIZ80_gp243 [Erwinia phage vB_EamM_Kwan]ANZ49408.1 hypothetical protein KWAN_56 [Erwinia phage vB_EamM_Kwan]